MYFRKPFLTFNILLITLITIYFVITIVSNSGYKHLIYSPQVLNNISDNMDNHLVSNKTVTTNLRTNISGNVLSNSSKLIDIQRRVKRTDEYLKKLSKFKRLRSNSKLVYPNEMSEMIEMTINHNSCSEGFGKDLLLLVLVFNRVDGFNRRQAIRETWGQQIKDNPKSKLYFTIGLSRDPSVQTKLVKENEKFGDILQFSYYEDYYNCTIKATALLRWTAISCPFVKFMLKVDDDSLVIPNNLLEFCDKTEDNSILGYLWKHPIVMRDIHNKWSVSVEDYPPKYYPDYIGGPYLIPGRSVLDLYEAAINKCLPALHFEDVYITGIVANVTQIERKKLDSLLYVWETCPLQELDFCYYKSFTIFWQGFNDKQMREVWQHYQKTKFCPSKGQQRC